MENAKIYEEIAKIRAEIEEKKNAIQALRKQIQPIKIEDYSLKNFNGVDVFLSSLFNERNELIIIHNMGKRCVYCTLWADEINGMNQPLADAVPFVVTSPDSPEIQKAFAESRNWKFPMLSAAGTSFIADLGFEPKPGNYHPGVSILIKNEEGLFKVGQDYFGPGDSYCGLWHFLDLLPKGVNGWEPKYLY